MSPHQLHPTELIHQSHVSCHYLLQGVVEFTQLLQGLPFCLLVLFLIKLFSGEKQTNDKKQGQIIKMGGVIVCLSCTCSPPGPEAAASVCRAVLPCSALICWFRIFHEKPFSGIKFSFQNLGERKTRRTGLLRAITLMPRASKDRYYDCYNKSYQFMNKHQQY